MILAWGKKVDTAFRERVFGICDAFGWNRETHASWLMSCIAFESGETFSPSIKNGAGSGATGLIQFMPSTARDLGTTTEALAKMSAVEQLAFVQRYFRPYASRIKSLSDMYMAILMPKFIGASEDAALFTSPTIAYKQNAGLDVNKNGVVTKAEASSKVKAKLIKGMQDAYALEI